MEQTAQASTSSNNTRHERSGSKKLLQMSKRMVSKLVTRTARTEAPTNDDEPKTISEVQLQQELENLQNPSSSSSQTATPTPQQNALLGSPTFASRMSFFRKGTNKSRAKRNFSKLAVAVIERKQQSEGKYSLSKLILDYVRKNGVNGASDNLVKQKDISPDDVESSEDFLLGKIQHKRLHGECVVYCCEEKKSDLLSLKVKAEAIIKIDCARLFNMQYDISKRKELFPNVDSVKVLSEDLKSCIDVIHVITTSPDPSSIPQRDYCIRREWEKKVTETETKYTLKETSTLHNQCPPYPEYIRGNNIRQLQTFTQTEVGTKWVFVASVQLESWAPQVTVRRGMLQNVQTMLKSVEKYYQFYIVGQAGLLPGII